MEKTLEKMAGMGDLKEGALERTPMGGYTQQIQFPWQKLPRTLYGKDMMAFMAQKTAYISRECTRKANQEKRAAEYREQKKADRRAAAAEVKVGDIFVNSWGYDQTNVDFAEVTALNGLKATLRPLSHTTSQTEGYSSMAGHAMPTPGAYKGGEFTKQLQGSAGHPAFSAKCGYWRKWDGRPQYESWYA